MKIFQRSCLAFMLTGLSLVISLHGQTVLVSQDDMDEAGIRNGGKRITLALSGDLFANFSDKIREDIIEGLSGSAAFEAVKGLIPLSAVVRISGISARITLPATSDYYITTDDMITVTVPSSALIASHSPVTATPDVTVTNLSTRIDYGGTITGTVTETAVRNGSTTLVLTASYNLWRTQLASSELTAVRNMFGTGLFRERVVPGITSDHVTVNDNVLSITFPVSADYYTGMDEVVVVTVSQAMFQDPETLENSQYSPVISNEDPVVVMQNFTFTEQEIRSNNHTVVVTVTGDKLGTSLNTTGLRNSFTGGPGWESSLEPVITFLRLNDFQFRVTIPAYSSFNIDVTENVSLSLGHENLQATVSGSFPDPVNRITITPLQPSLTITSLPSPLNEGNLNGAILTASLIETRLTDLVVQSSSISFNPPVQGLVAGTPVNETNTSFQVPLSFTGDLADDQTLTMVLDGPETVYGSGLTSNTLSLASAYEPAVSMVSIPNLPMGTGDEVLATIYFTENSEPGTFTYLAGTVEGEPFQAASLKKINSTTYSATFTIREETVNRSAAQSIRVRGLRFSNGVNTGDPADYDIIQDNDEIDTRPPVIQYIRYVDGTRHRIGAPVVGTVHADGSSYQFDHSRSFVNGVSFGLPRVQTVNNLDNTYSVTYIPAEGDNDVPQGSDIQVALVMVDRAGNISSPAVTTLYMGYSPVIDAHSPRLDSAVVRNPGTKGVGDQIEIYLYASETLNLPDPPISGTHVNFVPVSSPHVTLSHVSGNIYRLLYTVSAGDNGVGPGQLTYNFEMEDLLGNRSHSNMPLKNNNVTIGSSLPTATMVGGGSICEGDSLQAYLYLTGTAPWDVVIQYSKGNDTSLIGIPSPYSVWLHPDSSGTFSVGEVVDGNGIQGNTFGQVTVTVNRSTPVNIRMDRTTFLASEPGVQLRADLEPGIFSGKGVSAGYFYPSIATPAGSPHTITYAYSNLHGCVSFDRVEVEVLQGTGSVHLLSGEDTINVLCDDAGTYQVRGSNQEGIPGTFSLRRTNTTTVISGAITDTDLTDNMALFHSSGLTGGYDIIYSYIIDEVVLSATLFIRVDEVESLQITSTFPDRVCMNDEPYRLLGNMDGVDPLATWRFTGPGVSGSMAAGFYFNPGSPDASAGQNRITYEYTTESGCVSSVSTEVDNGFVPDVRFAPNSVCIPGEGGTVEFTNLTAGKYSVESWNWVFGDVNSGVKNFSNLENPEHFYSEPGIRTISLTAHTHDGCSATRQLDTLMADRPVAGFTWISDCYTRGRPVRFLNRSEASFSAIESYRWSFKTAQGAVLGELEAEPGEDTVAFPFAAENIYQVSLTAVNSGGCSDAVTREIALKSTINLTDGYLERFDNSEGDWSIHSENGNESWVWGVPDFGGFLPRQGDRGWYTDLPFGVAGYTENSWIQSPCFDFSRMKRPLVQLDLMKSFVPNLSGAVLQYQDVIEEGWKTVGLYQGGIEWYNSNSIFNRPGGSSFGWGLNVFVPDTQWKTSRHELDVVAGKTGIKFRIVIGTNGGQGIGNQGLAVDNFRIAERTRLSVLEHFTNSMDFMAISADAMVDQYYLQNNSDVLDLQYHMYYPGLDPMNLNNPDPPSTRAGTMGVGQVPYALLNGGVSYGHRYDFTSPFSSPGPDELKLVSLEIPDFSIDLGVNWLENSMQAEVTVTCEADHYAGNIQLYAAVVESAVTAYTGAGGDQLFRNVVLDMLPTQTGKLLGNGWYQGKTGSVDLAWTYRSFVENVEDLGVIVFIQDRDTREILQAAADFMTPQVGRQPRVSNPVSLEMFPNPAGEVLFIRLGGDLTGGSLLILTDLSGKVVMEEQVNPGYSLHQLDVSHLECGFYLVNRVQNGRLKGRGKLVIGR